MERKKSSNIPNCFSFFFFLFYCCCLIYFCLVVVFVLGFFFFLFFFLFFFFDQSICIENIRNCMHDSFRFVCGWYLLYSVPLHIVRKKSKLTGLFFSSKCCFICIGLFKLNLQVVFYVSEILQNFCNVLAFFLLWMCFIKLNTRKFTKGKLLFLFYCSFLFACF